MRLADLSVDDYRETTEKATRRRDAVNHRQSGDPAAFGRAMVELANAGQPPVRFAAGSDALKVMRDKGGALAESAEAWSGLSVSTDFPPGS
jgi:hypothetical protein